MLGEYGMRVSFDSLDIIGLICWMKFSIVGFDLSWLGGL